MEVTRQRLGSGKQGEFRARQLTARRMRTFEEMRHVPRTPQQPTQVQQEQPDGD